MNPENSPRAYIEKSIAALNASAHEHPLRVALRLEAQIPKSDKLKTAGLGFISPAVRARRSSQEALDIQLFSKAPGSTMTLQQLSQSRQQQQSEEQQLQQGQSQSQSQSLSLSQQQPRSSSKTPHYMDTTSSSAKKGPQHEGPGHWTGNRPDRSMDRSDRSVTPVKRGNTGGQWHGAGQ